MTEIRDFRIDAHADSSAFEFGEAHYSKDENSPCQWAIDSDEAGHPIYCDAVISDYLQRDCF